MNTLAQQQQAMLAVLFDWPDNIATYNIANYTDITWARGLKTYQANGHALAVRALQAAYPVLAQLMGEDSFAALARAFWHASPPVRGDIAQWGDGLASFVSASKQLADDPYLADVATLEWLLHICAGAADQGVDASSFALLSEHDPAELHLRLSPGCATLRSAWPVVSIVQAHVEGSPGFDEAGQRLRAAVAETALVWRVGLRPTVREAQPDEQTFLTAVLTGQPLDVALGVAPALDISAWLPMAVQSGLLLGVQRAAGGQPAALE